MAGLMPPLVRTAYRSTSTIHRHVQQPCRQENGSLVRAEALRVDHGGPVALNAHRVGRLAGVLEAAGPAGGLAVGLHRLEVVATLLAELGTPLGDDQSVHADGLLWFLEGEHEGEQCRGGRGLAVVGGDGADHQRQHQQPHQNSDGAQRQRANDR